MKELIKKRRYYLVWIFSLALLSHFSEFKIGAVKSFNWDIALMLTPYGLLKNKIFADTYLTPYYSLPQQSQPLDNPTALYSLLVLHTAVGLYVLYRFVRRS